MKSKLLYLSIIAATVVLLASCCQCRSYERKYGRPLVGTKWIMVQSDGRAFEAGDGYNITFTNSGTFTGTGDCNVINGDYTVPSDVKGIMSLQVKMTTRMSCPNGGAEQQFIEMLGAIDYFHCEGPYLYLFSKSELRSVFLAEGSEGVKLTDNFKR